MRERGASGMMPKCVDVTSRRMTSSVTEMGNQRGEQVWVRLILVSLAMLNLRFN